jgi:2-oxoglutarate ferredoxin oxidoreductase subunit delta
MPAKKTNEKPKGHIEIDSARCKGCHLCIAFCPKGSISESDDLNWGMHGMRHLRLGLP